MNKKIVILGMNQPRTLAQGMIERGINVVVDNPCNELSVVDEFKILPKIEKTRSEFIHGKEKPQKKKRNRNGKAFNNRVKKRRRKKKLKK